MTLSTKFDRMIYILLAMVFALSMKDTIASFLTPNGTIYILLFTKGLYELAIGGLGFVGIVKVARS